MFNDMDALVKIFRARMLSGMLFTGLILYMLQEHLSGTKIDPRLQIFFFGGTYRYQLIVGLL